MSYGYNAPYNNNLLIEYAQPHPDLNFAIHSDSAAAQLWLTPEELAPILQEQQEFLNSLDSMGYKAEHECTCGWPGSIPTGISISKYHTWICVGFSHRVTRSHESKTHGFSSTHGSTGTWKYLQVLIVLNKNKVYLNKIYCKYKYMRNRIILRHSVTPWRNQIWLSVARISWLLTITLTPIC